MTSAMQTRAAVSAALVVLGGPVWATETVLSTSAGPMTASPVAEGLQDPWALDFLPGGGFLITELDGTIKLFPEPGAAAVEVSGGPEVFLDGQGGLLDVMIPRDFATSREVWLSYAVAQGDGAGTALGRGILSQDGTGLENFTQVFEIPEGSSGGRHFGSRIVEAADGTIFLTVGDRGTGPRGMQAQDPMRGEGKVFHFTREGRPATTLPDALPGVWSLGHRNAQGATLDAAGRLLLVEHGARGGDELNAAESGKNYGWPVITYGVNYNGRAIGIGTAQEGMEQPLHYWDPSIAPSGLMVYSGALVPEWRGDIFFGSLNSDFLGRLDPDTPAATGFAEERIAGEATLRVRDVVEAPDGSIWFLSVVNETAYRLAPLNVPQNAP
jgi:glucose/arabinose dehydrogenase